MSKSGEMLLLPPHRCGLMLSMSVECKLAGPPAWPSARELVDGIVNDINADPVDLLSAVAGTGAGEAHYLEMLSPQYVRTLKELEQILAARCPRKPSEVCVLEIGSFLGVLCFALRKVGFQVTAQDIPEFQNNPRLQERYRRADIECVGVNLKRRHFPYPDAHFDFVIMCETLEHLNFNPLPAIKEINRVMKPGGLLYLTVPNQLSAGNRLKLLRGETIQASVGQFYEQLDLSLNMIVGLHWREYSKADLYALLEPMGFAVRHHYFYQDDKRHRYKRLKFSFKDVLGEFFPSLRPVHVLLAEKVAEDKHVFGETDALS
jgi:SAM-dependent methyltransferase